MEAPYKSNTLQTAISTTSITLKSNVFLIISPSGAQEQPDSRALPEIHYLA